MNSVPNLVPLFEKYSQNENGIIRQTAIQCLQIIQIAPEPNNGEFSQESAKGISNVLVCSLSYSFDQMVGYSKAEDLKLILRQIRFIDEVATEAPVNVSEALGKAFGDNFLENALKPELFKKTSQEISKATYYLETIFGALNHPILIKSIVTFILSTLIQTLITRLNHPASSVTAATLKFMNTLLELYCEDVWFELVLKYLMPQDHIMVSHRGQSIKKFDFEESSLRFLHFVPLRISEALGKIVTDEFLSYVNAEARRCGDLNKIQDQTCNFKFPSWQYNYDGTENWNEINSEEIEIEILIDAYNTPGHLIKGSFGPFLDALLKLLKNWKKCSPGVALGLTQVMSTLAGCRIPLISSLLLDPHIILQPAFSHCSFSALLTLITNEVEDNLRNVPQEYIHYVWDYLKQNLPIEELEGEETMKKDEMKIIVDREETSFIDSLSSTISGGNSLKAVGRNLRKTIFGAFSLNDPKEGEEEKEMENLTHTQLNLTTRKECSKQMTIKGILHCNWLLELAAIANQACWIQSFPNQPEQLDNENNDEQL